MTTDSTSPDTVAPSPFAAPLGELRTVLQLDAIVTGANGIAYLVLAGPLADLFGVPESFLRGVGVFLTLFAAAVWATASRATIKRALAASLAIANATWVVASVAAVAGDLHGLSTEGAVWTTAQAVVVAGFAALQLRGLRLSR